MWDAETAKALLTLNGHSESGTPVAWSPDGKRLATGSDDKTAKVWDAASGQELLTLRGHTGAVYSVAWSPDGQAAGDGEFGPYGEGVGRGQREGIADPAAATTATCHSVAWSPDGKRLATASCGPDGEGVGRGQRAGIADPERSRRRCDERGLEPGRQAAGDGECRTRRRRCGMRPAGRNC